MALLKALGGTSDILPEEAKRWQDLEGMARRVLNLYGFQEIRTPLMEDAAVFTSSLGETAEIVTKQMYTFQDRGGRQVVLRPEGTASVVRALIENGLDKTAGITRFYYLGPMFRAERPQAGRKRQFHQLGVEVFGSSSPHQDAEVMALLMHLLQGWGVGQAALMVNNLGCSCDRPKMQRGLRDYFQKHLQDLCEDCRRRLEVNPLRILDCKNEKCRSVAQGSMKWDEWLCEPCKGHFEKVKGALKGIGVPFQLDPHLVRGLDYYTRTAFEVVCPGLGAQNAVGGGGRYDQLVETLGGTPTPAVGFAVGLERILMVQEAGRSGGGFSDRQPQVFVATVSSAQIPDGLALGQRLRGSGVAALTNLEERPLKRQLEQASKTMPQGTVLILGEEEVRKGLVTVKELSTGQQRQIPRDDLVSTCFQRNP